MIVIIVFLIVWVTKLTRTNNQLICNAVFSSFGYKIKNIDLFLAAFTHKSISRENNYERLEILGDSIIQFFVTEMLYMKYPNHSEGQITVMRQNLVNDKTLNQIFSSLKLKTVVDKINIGLKDSKICADIFEALVGAIYLDSNYNSAKKATVLFFETLISNSLLLKDSKTRLQEYLHSKHIPLPIYSTHKSSKKSYKYLVECLIPSKNIKESLFTNKVKTAQQKLAQIILNKLNEEKS